MSQATIDMPFKSLFLAALAALVLTACGGDNTTNSSSSAGATPKSLAGVVVNNTALFTGNRSNYTITKTASGYTVVDNVGSDGTTTLGNVTLMRFADTDLSMDANGIPGQIYRLYKAAFNRAPDVPGLGWWISEMNAGMSLTTVASNFELSSEFQTLYGTNTSNSTLISLLYQNVLHRVPSQSESNYWLNVLSTGQLNRQQVLYYFSESDENKAQVLSAIQNGMAYSSYHFTPAPSLQVSAGSYHGAAIKADGSLWMWGGNDYGQLGLGAGTNSLPSELETGSQYQPVQIDTGYSVVSAGNRYTLAIKTDGTLWAWGDNLFGKLGNGFSTSYANVNAFPRMIGSNFTAVSAGVNHSLGLKTDGTLWAWGPNESGQLGDGTTIERDSPVQIGTGFTAIAAGDNYSLALKNNGTLWAWGDNSKGQLGDGTNTGRKTPVQIGSGFVSISTRSSHSVAVKSDGTLWAWGLNSSGQLGDGTTTNRSIPVQIGTGFISASAGQTHSLAIKSDGTVWSWGSNSYGQLGDGTTATRLTPIQINTGFTAISADVNYTLGIKSDGSLWSWGLGGSGTLGIGSTSNSAVPVQFSLSPFPYAGTWTGGYNGNDAGTCSMGINGIGVIGGSCSGGRAGTLSISGSVNRSGSATFQISGGSISGTTFTGQFVSTSLVNGFWSIPSTGYSGTWSLHK